MQGWAPLVLLALGHRPPTWVLFQYGQFSCMYCRTGIKRKAFLRSRLHRAGAVSTHNKHTCGRRVPPLTGPAHQAAAGMYMCWDDLCETVVLYAPVTTLHSLCPIGALQLPAPCDRDIVEVSFISIGRPVASCQDSLQKSKVQGRAVYLVDVSPAVK